MLGKRGGKGVGVLNQHLGKTVHLTTKQMGAEQIIKCERTRNAVERHHLGKKMLLGELLRRTRNSLHALIKDRQSVIDKL